MPTVRIQTDLPLLLRSMAKWKVGGVPTFNDLVASACLHGMFLAGRTNRGRFDILAATRLQVSYPTIQRWAFGISAPHDPGKESAIHGLRALLVELRDAAEAKAPHRVRG